MPCSPKNTDWHTGSTLILKPDHVHALGMISIEMANLEMHLGSLLGALTHVGTFQLNAGSGYDDSRASVYAEETTSPGSALRAGDHDVSTEIGRLTHRGPNVADIAWNQPHDNLSKFFE